MRCDRCKHVLAPDAPIWYVALGYFSKSLGQGKATGRVCRGCAEKHFYLGKWWQRWQPPRPCTQCGRLVHWPEKRLRPKHFVCSPECARRAYYPNHRPAVVRACASCGEQFTPKRGDARFCSIACKQRAYRIRSQET
jgi:hypothetical protein